MESSAPAKGAKRFIYKDETLWDHFETFVGGVVATTIVVLNYVSAGITLVLAFRLVFYHRLQDLLAAALWVGVALAPCKVSHTLRQSWLFRCIGKYFRVQIILDAPREEYEKHVAHNREVDQRRKDGTAVDDDGQSAKNQKSHFFFLIFPHGALSLGGLAAVTVTERDMWGPTAVADVLLRVPLLKQLYGIFGIVGSSSKSIIATLQKTHCCLYPGGVAEMFLTSPDVEHLYFENRKGCIKVAHRAGATVVPCYVFGNSHLLNVVRFDCFSSVSRLARCAFTYIWGRWYLPVPFRTTCHFVVGKPIPLGPPREGDAVTNEQINQIHKQVKDQVEELYMKYRKELPEYANKPLVIG